ncbi:4'-phosphopantetheinyl transferase Npt [Streptomyces sp. enrichment culture]
MVARLTAEHPRLPWDRLLFSAKEAVYKAWFPATRRWIGTAAVEVAFTAGGLLTAEIRPGRTARPDRTAAAPVPAGWPTGDGEPAVARCAGRWRIARGLVLTAVAVPAAAG